MDGCHKDTSLMCCTHKTRECVITELRVSRQREREGGEWGASALRGILTAPDLHWCSYHPILRYHLWYLFMRSTGRSNH
eukprot:3855439-Rhodomonas_salina.2